MFHRLLFLLYGFILCLLFGVITAAGLLSFGSFYQPVPVMILTFILTGMALFLYFRHDSGWLDIVFAVRDVQQNRLISAAAGAGLALFISIFLLRLVLYPASAVGNIIPDDAISYHFPKAMELIRTGTLWNIAHLYGEYPIGYESLIAFGLLLTGGWQFAGIVHGLILLLLVLSIYLLLYRYTHLPDGLLFLISVGIFFYPDLYSQALIVGKNDLFLTATILGAVLHSPLTLRGRKPVFHPFGLAMLTAISLATKPGGIWILAFLWVIVLFYWWQAYRTEQAKSYLRISHFMLAILLMFPGGLWVIRNVVMMGSFFSPEVSSFFTGSIVANLTNIRLYTSSLDSVVLIGLMAWVFLLIATLASFVPMGMTLLLLVMVVAFAVMPLGVFHTPAKTAVHVEWRYTTHLFFYLLILVITRFEFILQKLFDRISNSARIAAGLLIAGYIALLVVLVGIGFFRLNPDNVRKLQDPYRDSVGAKGYHSVYDYVQKEIKNSVIFSHGGLAFYLYNPAHPTNQITSHTRHPLGMPDLIPLPAPDYLVYVPENLPSEARTPFIYVTEYQWELIYEDAVGAVYQRVSPD